MTLFINYEQSLKDKLHDRRKSVNFEKLNNNKNAQSIQEWINDMKMNDETISWRSHTAVSRTSRPLDLHDLTREQCDEYTGGVDEKNRPHGSGRLVFSGGDSMTGNDLTLRYQTSKSASSSKFHYFASRALLATTT